MDASNVEISVAPKFYSIDSTLAEASSMGSTMLGCDSKNKCSTRSSGSGGFVRSEMRLIVAFQAGAAAGVFFMIVIFMPLDWSSDGGFLNGASSLFSRKGQFSQKWDAARGNAFAYVGEWELPQVRDVRAEDTVSEIAYGEVPRRFTPFGTGNFLFTLFAAYRSGPQSFAVLGIAPRIMHKHWNKPGFTCFWESHNDTSSSPSSVHSSKMSLPHGDKVIIQGTATNHYPQELDFEIPAQYTTVVVHCTFDSPVGLDGKIGDLRMIADHGKEQKNTPLGPQSVEFVALTEDGVAYNATSFDAPFQYEYMYCGGPLYGTVNPDRLREWLAYHMRLFGERSHFIFYDDGGINDDSWKVLKPWINLGRLTIMNVKQESRYDTYYHSQYLLTNDCLYRAKPLARWAFFFDSDEYIYITVSPDLEQSFHKVMSDMVERGRNATSVQMRQRIMSHTLCVRNDSAPTLHQSQWAVEKLVYQRVVKDEELHEISGQWTSLEDYKTAVQPKHVLLMGVHDADELEVPEGSGFSWNTCSQPSLLEEKGCTYNSTGDKLVYYHYHGTTSLTEELCQEFVDPQPVGRNVEHDGITYKFDNSLSLIVDIAKTYELDAIHPPQ